MRSYFIIAAILLLTYGAYYAARFAVMPTPPSRVGPEQMSLSSLTQVATNVILGQNWIDPPGSTLIFYIYPQIHDRTSVVGNEYVNAVQIGTTQNLKILIAPDAGRSNMLAPVVLEVYVAGNNDPEVIEINSIFLQRWNYVAIVKKGRKFNIYVNGKLDASKMCSSMPDYDTTQPLRIGDSRLGGKIALMSLAPYAMEIDEIRTLYKDSADNQGKPHITSGESIIPEFSLEDTFNSILCPGGNCDSGVNKGPMYKWSSQYS